MITYTILKTCHCREDNARKLWPHIRACSVYAPELGFLTLGNSRKLERGWQNMLQSKLSVEQVYGELEPTSRTNETEIFQLMVYKELYRQKKPIIFLERWWDPKRAEELLTAANNALNLCDEGLIQILKGNELQGLKTYVTGERINIELTDLRDERIARNLENVEDLVQDVYPSLKDKPLKLCVEIGATHHPEKHTDLPIETVDCLTHDADPIRIGVQQIIELVREPTVDTDRLMPLLKELAKRTRKALLH